MQHWSEKTDIPVKNFLSWLGLSKGKYHDWKQRVGQVNRHNGLTPRHFWLLEWERKAIEAYAIDHPLEGYRRLTFRQCWMPISWRSVPVVSIAC
ncbi:MAG: hypothetical protein ACRESZ_09140 [Methylococcales bacterium]